MRYSTWYLLAWRQKSQNWNWEDETLETKFDSQVPQKSTVTFQVSVGLGVAMFKREIFGDQTQWNIVVPYGQTVSNPFDHRPNEQNVLQFFDERFVDLPELSNISKHHQTRQCPNGKMFGNQMLDRVLSPKISLLDSRSAAFPRRAQLTERLKEAVRDARVTSLGILCYSVFADDFAGISWSAVALLVL